MLYRQYFSNATCTIFPTGENGWGRGESLHRLRICLSPHLEKSTYNSHIFVLPSLNNTFHIPIKTSFLAVVIASRSISLAEHLFVLLIFQIIYQGQSQHENWIWSDLWKFFITIKLKDKYFLNSMDWPELFLKVYSPP